MTDRTAHARARLLERYRITATPDDIVDLEAEIHKNGMTMRTAVDGRTTYIVRWRGQVIKAVLGVFNGVVTVLAADAPVGNKDRPHIPNNRAPPGKQRKADWVFNRKNKRRVHRRR